MNQKDIQEFIQLAEIFMESIQKSIDKLKSQLSEPEPLRAGRCIVGPGGEFHLIINETGGTLRLYQAGYGLLKGDYKKYKLYKDISFEINIFDLLQSLSEPTEEFEINGSKIFINVHGNLQIDDVPGGDYVVIDKTDMEQFWLKLGAMVLQAKGK